MFGGQAHAPVLAQIVADQAEQQQHHDARAERDDLHQAFRATPAEIRNAVAPRHADAAAQAARKARAPAACASEQREERRTSPPLNTDEQEPVAHDPVDQERDRDDGRAEGEHDERRRRPDVTPQHANRRHARQLQQRRQCESREHRHRGDEAEPSGSRSAGGSSALSSPRIARSSHSCARKPSAEPTIVAATAITKLQDAHAQRERARRAQRLHQRDGIQMPLHIAPRRHRHRDGAQQHADQTRETQEAPGAIHRVLDLRARLARCRAAARRAACSPRARSLNFSRRRASPANSTA